MSFEEIFDLSGHAVASWIISDSKGFKMRFATLDLGALGAANVVFEEAAFRLND